MTAFAVELDGVAKHFRRPSPWPWKRGTGAPLVVLDGLDLEVGRGDRLALLGANGEGKTTILKLIAGLLLPDAGTVRVQGHDTGRDPRAASEGVAFVLADERSFHWRLNVEQNMKFFAQLNGIPGPEFRARLTTLLERLDLAQYRRARFGSLSSGTKQRMALVRALLTRPRILLLDEPTRSIDGGHASAVWDVVQDELDEAGATAVLVTHNTTEALTLGERVAILAAGRVALETSTRELQTAARGLHGFTMAVAGLNNGALQRLECLPGVARLEVLTEIGGEKTLGVTLVDEDLPVGPILSAVTSEGASVTSFQPTMPVETALERLLAESRQRIAS